MSQNGSVAKGLLLKFLRAAGGGFQFSGALGWETRMAWWLALSLLLAQPAGDLVNQARRAMAAERFDEAQAALETALSREPSQPYPRFLLGLLFYLKNDFPRARDALARAESDDARVLLYQALTEEALNQAEAAEKFFARAVQLDQRGAEARVAYARMLSAQGRLDEAARLIDEALKLAPKSPEALYEQSRLLFEKGAYQKAAGFGEQALARHEPALERRIRHLLIRAYQKLGNAEMAQKHRAIFEKLPNPLVR
jgi:tetratricopeptide (TPR) repeat protein